MSKTKFAKIKSIKACVLKQPNAFFSSILLQKCSKNNLDINEVEKNRFIFYFCKTYSN